MFSREIGDSDLGGTRNVSMVISTPASSPEFQPIFQHAWGEGYQHLINLAISLLPEFQWKKEICPHFRPLTLRSTANLTNRIMKSRHQYTKLQGYSKIHLSREQYRTCAAAI